MAIPSSDSIREKFIDFMKKNGHAIIPNISLVPINDPTLLFVNSGMFPLVNYLMGEEHPQGKRIANFQRCIRTEDIDEIGDTNHHTFFEMIGNWSLGDYFKDKQLHQVFKLYTEVFGLDPQNLYVTVFKGNEVAPKDERSIELWKEIYADHDMKAEYTEDPFKVGKEDYRIFGLGKEDNWWQRGEAPGELGGPDSEIFYDLGAATNPDHEGEYAINDESGRYLEVGTSVFMQFRLDDNLEWEEMKQKNVDFGGGFERIVTVAQGHVDNYDTDLFQPMIREMEHISGKKWKDENIDNIVIREEQNKDFRAIADHIRAATFILADGVIPSNKDQGYILRRLIRRMIRKARNLDVSQNFTRKLAFTVIENYKNAYPHLEEKKEFIQNNIDKEEIKFRKTLEKGLKEFQKVTAAGVEFTGEEAFRLYETYGFPLEMTIEELEDDYNDTGDFSQVDRKKLVEGFKEAEKKHKEKSRQGAEKKFKGGLADQSEETTRLHTAHHLLLAALQEVLGPHVHQKGSNITAERLRIDFSHTGGLSDEEIDEVERIVNAKIEKGYVVEKKTMPKAKAEEIGAEMEFGAKYGDLVDVYFIKHPEINEVFSKEFCGGPHVENTSELAESGKFHILKEKSNGAGVRRIKAVLK
jgi:alanyl-tRNA synthetase